MSWNHAYFVKHFTWRKFRFKNDFSSYNVNVKKASVGGSDVDSSEENVM